MGWWGRALAAALWPLVGLAPAVAAPAKVDVGTHRWSGDARHMAEWIVRSADHQGRAFAVVDKKHAQIYVFNREGRLAGASNALLGQAMGDHSAPGVGDRAQTGNVPLRERTTPAGRFASEPGRNLSGEHVVWVDYEAAFSIHRVRPGASQRKREARLASPTVDDNRASAGCVVVPVAFYTQVVMPLLGRSPGVVYVLPESGLPRRLPDAH